MINFISVDNGVGLSRDMKLFAEVAGIKYNFVDFLKGQAPPHADTNIFFEVCRKDMLNARRNIIIPNPEWFASEWLTFIDRFDLVLCKTRHCQEIFRRYVGDRAVYIGWTSDDRMDSKVNRTPAFLHAIGRSETKGTTAVYKAFTENKIGRLTLITSKWAKGGTNSNVTVYNVRLKDEDYRIIQNAYRFHICPSEYEGFGHYINEALSVGAIVLTIDAAPMNELCRPDYAVLIPAQQHKHMGIVKTWTFKPTDLSAAVYTIMNMTDEEVSYRSARARLAYEMGRNEFIANVKKLDL